MSRSDPKSRRSPCKKKSSAFAAFVGIDWADRKHDICLQVPGTDAVEASVIEHRPKAIEDWAQKLRERFAGRRIAVCLELSQGPIVSALLEHDIFVIFPVNPSTLAKYRRAFTPSRAKDDPTDAAIALELLVRHREKLKPLRHESPNMRALRRLVEARRDLVQDRVRLTQPPHVHAEGLFPAGSRLVSRQGDRGLRRVPRAVAVLARRSARSARDHRRLLPRPQRPSRCRSSTAASTPSSPSDR